ncbi:MAG: polysaccharide biosynthesis C-terminal domain-containing protein, partial [Leptospiraceae bacterium]|nr:polysaccharide biosynthesis C-terminal domain-containing protein [Leptospiraceae bacterium]
AIPMYSINKILTSSYYAFKDTKTPLKVNMISFTLNMTLSVSFMNSLKHSGLALASAISSTVTFSLLFYFFRKHSIIVSFKKLFIKIQKLLLPLFGMGVFLYFLQKYGYSLFFEYFKETRISHENLSRIFISLGISFSALIYFLICKITRIQELNIILNKIGSKNYHKKS